MRRTTPPCLEAVDGEWSVELAGELQVGAEDGALDIDRWVSNPLIQPTLADRGVGVAF